MYGVVEVGGGSLELTANAATPYRVRQIFGIDILKTFMTAETDGGVETSGIIPQLAYVMNCQALKVDMSKLNMETFYEWCEDFGPTELLEKGNEILDIYVSNTRTSSKPKKNNAKQSVK